MDGLRLQHGEACRMQPLIVTVAAVGAELTPEQTPHLPLTPVQLGETAARCQDAGASLIHVHCRNDDGTNTSDVARFAAALEEIRKRSDLIVQFTTGGAIGMTPEERAAPLSLRPEMGTLTCGTVNFGDDIFENSFPIMRAILAEMKRYDVVPELEVFDAGHIANARRLAREGLLEFPRHFDFVLGVPGGLEATARNLIFLVEDLPAGSTWSVAGIGRAQFEMAQLAISTGGNVRVGIEDNIYLGKGLLASNEQLVARAASLCAEFGRPLATPAQAREILGLTPAKPRAKGLSRAAT